MIDEPIIFRPIFKSVIWGGDKIAEYKGVDVDTNDIGESWEISAVPGNESVVAYGPYKGMTLTELVEKFGAGFLGTQVIDKFKSGFPLLIKIIDARADLSVQVHPDDSLAGVRHNSPGKTEMWYIIDCLPDAKIYSGLKAPLSPESYENRIADNSVMDVVGVHFSAPGQFYYVPAGTIHAIGAGNLLAEVQQTSDITYRVYDYDRRDAEGKPRQLHTDLAKDAIDYRFPNDITPTAQTFSSTTEGVVSSPYFKTDLLALGAGDTFCVNPDLRCFVIIMVTEGEISIQRTADSKTFSYPRGTTVLLPASMPECLLTGPAKALVITIP